MYRFTNGIVVYDEATRDKYISSGMTLIEEKPVKKEEKQNGESEADSTVKSNEFEQTRKRTTKFGRSFK